MANEDNLKGHGFDELTASERRELAKKAGKASGVARRRKRDLKNRLKDALEYAAGADSAEDLTGAIGVNPDDATNYDVIIARLMAKALKGDIRAMQMIFNYIGETPEEKRAQSEEKRQAKLFKLQLDQMDNLDKDNDAVLQYIDAMKSNVKDGDTGAEQKTD